MGFTLRFACLWVWEVIPNWFLWFRGFLVLDLGFWQVNFGVFNDFECYIVVSEFLVSWLGWVSMGFDFVFRG